MLSRRCRIQARPNIRPGITGSKCTAKEQPPVETSSISPTAKPKEGLSPASTNLNAATSSFVSPNNNSTANVIYNNTISPNIQDAEKSSNVVVNTNNNINSDAAVENVEAVAVETNLGVNHSPDSNRTTESQDVESRRRNISTCSSATTTTKCSSPPPQSVSWKRKQRKKFTGEEPLDPKKMTMHDLISWNPKNDTMMKYHSGKRSRVSSVTSTASDINPKDKNTVKNEENLVMPAPKVRIAEDGSLVLDESSLTIAQEKLTNIWETVDEDRVIRKVTSLSFRKSALRKSLPWTSLETDLFYIILRATGPDFGLMHEFFPSRSRSELKSKFNKEERTNWDRLKHSLSTPTLLDDSLYDEANRLLKKINEEALKKKEKVHSSKRSKLENDEANTSWDEDEVDLVAEAEKEIAKIENENNLKTGNGSASKGKATLKTSKPLKKMKAEIMDETSKEAKRIITNNMRRKYDAEAKHLHGPVIAGLSANFPSFILEYVNDADAVTIHLNEEQIPVVKVPLDTEVRVLPEDDKQPERVFFECFGGSGRDVKRYIIKHQSGPGESSSGFLHLFGAVS
uniref:Myb_DNA-bind_7 domain-containing protein n=1 Tax=Syphacia muris TaxID=451379 RepID=A0A0N5AB19_9BILA